MKLEIANETSGIVHIALYKRSPLRPSEPVVAWTIVSPPPRGRAIFSIPRDYRVLARYSFSPEDSQQPIYQTNILSLRRNHDSLAIREIRLGRSAWGAILARNVREPGLGELRIENDFSTGIWCYVQLGEHDIYLPRPLPPHGVLIDSLAAPFFLAVVSPLVHVGVPLAEEEIRATEVAAGEGGVFTIHSTTTQRYRINPGAPHHAERVTRPKKEAASVRTKRTKTLQKASMPFPAQTKKTLQASKEKRGRTTPKAEVKEQATEKEQVRKPASRRRRREKTKEAS